MIIILKKIFDIISDSMELTINNNNADINNGTGLMVETKGKFYAY